MQFPDKTMKSSDTKKADLLRAYGIIPVVLAMIPFSLAALISVFLYSREDYSFLTDVLSHYPVLTNCRLANKALLASTVAIYWPLSFAIFVAAAAAFLITLKQAERLKLYVGITSALFSVPFVLLHYPDVMIVSSESVARICADREFPVAATLNLMCLLVGTYTIFGNLSIALQCRREEQH